MYKFCNNMPYFVWKGVKSTEYGIIVNKLPELSSPKQRYESIIVPGRSGTLNITDNSFETEIKTVNCTIMDMDRFNEICSWLKGSDNVIFSNLKGYFYNAVIKNAIPFSNFLSFGDIRTFPIVFEAYPLRYSVNWRNDILTIVNNVTITGKGTHTALPIIDVYGTGDITLQINGETIYLDNVGGKITINSELMDTYKDGVSQNNKMGGSFPILLNSTNTISFTGNVQKLVINPMWRWL